MAPPQRGPLDPIGSVAATPAARYIGSIARAAMNRLPLPSRLPGHLLLLAALVLPATFAGGADSVREVSVDQVASMLGRPGVFVYDANTEEVYRKGHLPGARYLPSRFDPETLPADKGAQLVFYCKNPH